MQEHVYMKWTQTGLKSQTALKCCSIYMAIYTEISLQQLSKQWKDSFNMCQWYLLINASLINVKQMLHYWLFFKQ